ncbi:hypothetical protein [Nocardioides sp. CER19]|nr:hypothetical protein [Nocardioides sp. CER19]MDH2412843.1 hypothetical protein [Nocardioides sp. CER19]
MTDGYTTAFLGTAGIALLAAAVTLTAVRRSDRVEAVAPTH